MNYEDQIRGAQLANQQAQGALANQYGGLHGRADADCSPKPLTIHVAKTIVVTLGNRPLSTRLEREFREEIAGKIGQGYRVKALVETGRGGVEMHLEKYEPWTLDELMSDINSKLKGE